MKTILKKVTLSAAVLGLVILAGCAKEESQVKPTYDAAPAVEKTVTSDVPADKSVRYYGQNLELAKEVWANCRKIGPTNMSPEEKKNCVNAQSAWEMQRRKAPK